jgi:hypothetical protein
VECENINGTSINGGNWNHLKIIHKIPDQGDEKARNQETAQKKKKHLWALTEYSK